MFGCPPQCGPSVGTVQGAPDAKSAARAAFRTGRALSAMIPAMCNLYSSFPLPGRDPAHLRHRSRRSRQPAAAARHLSGPAGSRGPHRRRRAGADDDALGASRHRRSSARSRSPTCATSARHTGDLGSSRGNRCLVPATSFSEYADTKPRKTPGWFALDESRPLFAFAGSGGPGPVWRGPKRDEPLSEEHRLFSFLTTEANGIVGPVHPKAMPVLLTTPEEWRARGSKRQPGGASAANPPAGRDMTEVARGDRKDGG